MERENNIYEVSKLAGYWGEDDTKLPIILGSNSGTFLRNAKTRKEVYDDTEVLWLTGEAKSCLVWGSQGSGKTMLTTLIETQLITAKKRFGDEFKQFDLPHIILDSAGEFTHTKFALPLENPRLLERMKPYYKWMPFLKPTSIIEKCVYYTPVQQRSQLAARNIYGDFYVGLKAADLKKIEFQQAFQLVLELLNLEEQDPAARIVRRGCVELMNENPTFFDIFKTMLEEEKREVRRRKSQSVSRQAQVMLYNALYDGEVEIGDSPSIKEDLNNRKVAVYHFPIQSAGLNTNKVMFTLYLATALDYVRQGSPPFSLYGEEMHKPLIEEPNSVFSRRIRDVIQLERKTGRLAFFVVRLPEYSKELIDETDFILTSQLRAESAKLVEGFIPQIGTNFEIEELKVRTTPDGRRDSNDWMLLEKGKGNKKFSPIVPCVQP